VEYTWPTRAKKGCAIGSGVSVDGSSLGPSCDRQAPASHFTIKRANSLTGRSSYTDSAQDQLGYSSLPFIFFRTIFKEPAFCQLGIRSSNGPGHSHQLITDPAKVAVFLADRQDLARTRANFFALQTTRGRRSGFKGRFWYQCYG